MVVENIEISIKKGCSYERGGVGKMKKHIRNMKNEKKCVLLNFLLLNSIFSCRIYVIFLSKLCCLHLNKVFVSKHCKVLHVTLFLVRTFFHISTTSQIDNRVGVSKSSLGFCKKVKTVVVGIQLLSNLE